MKLTFTDLIASRKRKLDAQEKFSNTRSINTSKLDALCYDNIEVIKTFCKRYDVELKIAEEYFTELKKYLYLCSETDVKMAPTPEIDKIWRIFIFFKYEYEAYCIDLLKKNIEYIAPVNPELNISLKEEEALQHTISMYREFLGEFNYKIWGISISLFQKLYDDIIDKRQYILSRKYNNDYEIPTRNIDEEYEEDTENIVFCILDIETDGPRKMSFSNSSLTFEYPNVVQIAWLLMNENGEIIRRKSELINYPNITYTKAFAISKIDIELVKRIGRKPEDVYYELVFDIGLSTHIVGHNIDYYLSILKNQLKKYDSSFEHNDPFKNRETICTMNETVDFCNIEGSNGLLKNPKLTDLYKKLFDEDIEQNHKAEDNVMLTALCFKELLDREEIILFEDDDEDEDDDENGSENYY